MSSTNGSKGKASPRKRIRKRSAADSAHAPSQVEARLLSAIERMVDRGDNFASLTVAQIATEAGIGRATFYLHFKDKGELVHRLMQGLTKEVVNNAGSWFEGGRVDARSLQHALRGIITTFWQHAAVLFAVSETAPGDESVAAAHSAMMQELCAQSRKAIAAVRRQGQATSGANHELADLLTLSIEAYCAKHIHAVDQKNLEKLIERFSHICGRAIFAEYPERADARKSSR